MQSEVAKVVLFIVSQQKSQDQGKFVSFAVQKQNCDLAHFCGYIFFKLFEIIIIICQNVHTKSDTYIYIIQCQKANDHQSIHKHGKTYKQIYTN